MASSPPPSAPDARGPRRRSVVGAAVLFSLGALGAYLLLIAIERLRTELIVAALSLLIALTLEPFVGLLQRAGLPRWAAALLAWLSAMLVLITPLVLAIDAAGHQLPALIKAVPQLISNAEDNLGRLGERLRSITSSSSSTASITPDKVVTYVLQGGKVVFDAVGGIVVVAALSLWLAITLPQLTDRAYRLVPASRRSRVSAITDELLRQISRFMMANVLTSVLAGVATAIWAWALGIPYPLLLGSLVAVLDLIPTIGSTIGGVIVSLIALTVSLPVALATAVFYIGFRLAEDYLIQPRAMRYSVELPGVVTVPAVLLGGAVLGIPGALFAVPAALVVRVLVRDVAWPALERR